VLAPLVLGDDEDSRLAKLVNAWEGKGVLVHVASTGWATDVLNQTSSGSDAPFSIDNDCGPMCSAWSIVAQGIPMYAAVFSRIGIMVDANSSFSNEYVQSLYPTDAATSARQFCAEGDPMSGPHITELGTYGPPGITTVGCPEDDDDCKFLAAGGSPGFPAVIGLGNYISNYSAISNVTQYNWDGINAGNATECKNPHKCSIYHPEQTPSAANWIANVITPIEKALAQVQMLPPNIVRSFAREARIQEHMSNYGCKFDAKVQSNWQVIKDTYLEYLSFAVAINSGVFAVQEPYWNEVNVYAPVEPTQKATASKSFEQGIVGFFFVPPTGEWSDGDRQQHDLVKQLVQAFNTRNPDSTINMYHCTGRTQWAGVDLKNANDTIIGANGCAVGPVDPPSTSDTSQHQTIMSLLLLIVYLI